jgi:ankyrin repeat protein
MQRLILTALVLLTTSVTFAASLPPLVEAAKAGNRDTLRALLQKGANANDADGDGTTALHWASYRNDPESVDLLIKAGAKVNSKTDLGVTPLWIASQNGGDAVVRRLLQGVVGQLAAKGANVNARGTRGQTALMWAVSQKHAQVVTVLLSHKPDIHLKTDTYQEVVAVPPHSYDGNSRMISLGAETALLFAARVGDAASAKLLLAAGANPNNTDAWGVSATSLAAHANHTDIVIMLLDKGADPNGGKAPMTALHNAVMHRNEKAVAALLARGANANATVKNWTPSRRSSDDLNYPPEFVGATPLWLAARSLAPAVMKLLLDHGADPKFVHRGEYVPESRDEAFKPRQVVTTPVMAALGLGNVKTWAAVSATEEEALTLEAVKLAAAPGVDLNVANTDGKTALDQAKTLKYESVVKLLTERGAKAK